MTKKTIVELIDFVKMEINNLQEQLKKLEKLNTIQPELIKHLEEHETLKGIIEQIKMIPNQFKLTLIDLDKYY
nr:MAG: hypothetical protein [uncultured archaeon]